MYLLDTNIVIFFFRGNKAVVDKFFSIGFENCYISEITLAELKFGAEKSERPDYHKNLIKEFVNQITVLPIINSLDFYAKEKARLEKKGAKIDDFDLLIAATAVRNNLILITNNTKHFKRIHRLTIQDWSILN